jgi:hydrogenase maturation protease
MELTQQPLRGAHILIQAIGNPSRGDDALGPRLIECLVPSLQKSQGSQKSQESQELQGPGGAAAIDLEWVYQLQIEQAEQWSHFDLVILVDAHVSLTAPFLWSELSLAPGAGHELGISSHQVSPLTVLALNRRYFQRHPKVFLLALQAKSFELGADLSSVALNALAMGLQHLTSYLVCVEA